MNLKPEPFITLDGVYPFWEAEEKFGLEAVVLVTTSRPSTSTRVSGTVPTLWIGPTGLTFYDDDVTDIFSPHTQEKSVISLMALGKSTHSKLVPLT